MYISLYNNARGVKFLGLAHGLQWKINRPDAMKLPKNNINYTTNNNVIVYFL